MGRRYRTSSFVRLPMPGQPSIHSRPLFAAWWRKQFYWCPGEPSTPVRSLDGDTRCFIRRFFKTTPPRAGLVKGSREGPSVSCGKVTKRSENIAKGSVRAAVWVCAGGSGIAEATGRGGEKPFRCLAIVLPSFGFTLSCRRAPKYCETAYRKMAHSYAKQEFMSNRIPLRAPPDRTRSRWDPPAYSTRASV